MVANIHNGYTKYVADKVGWPINWWPVNWWPTLETCRSEDPAQARRTSSPGRPSGERHFPDLNLSTAGGPALPPASLEDDLQGGTEITHMVLHMIRSTTHSERKWISNDSYWRGAGINLAMAGDGLWIPADPSGEKFKGEQRVIQKGPRMTQGSMSVRP